MAIPVPAQFSRSQALVVGLLGLLVLFLGGLILGAAFFEGPWAGAWVPVVLTGVAFVFAALGAWFMWYGLAKVYLS